MYVHACVLSCFCRFLLFVTPRTVVCQVFYPWDSPGKNTGVSCHALIQIFPTHGLNPHLWQLQHCRRILYPEPPTYIIMYYKYVLIYIYIYIYICNMLFIHSFISVYLGCCQFLAIVNNVVMNMGMQILLKTWVFLILLNIYPEVKWLDHIIIQFLIFQELPYCCPYQLSHFASLPTVHRGSNFCTTLSSLVIFWGFLRVAILMDMRW